MNRVFLNRTEAGEALAEALVERPHDEMIVLGLARGGVPVAYEIARRTRAPMDVLSVRKLGAPGHREFAIGALASGGVEVLHPSSVRLSGISERGLKTLIAEQKKELERREQLFRRGRGILELRGRTVVIVDDGMATGATMVAAIRAVRKLGAGSVIVAVPTASRQALEMAADEADDVVCIVTPEPYYAVGASYYDFPQVDDGEVRRLLELCDSEYPGRGRAHEEADV